MNYKPLQVKFIRLHDGERFPIIVCRETGLPSFYPNGFLAAKIRGKSNSARTMTNAGHSLKCLWVWAAIEKIDVVNRMLICDPLDSTEIDSLVHHLRIKYKKHINRLNYLLNERKKIVRRSVSVGQRQDFKVTKEMKKDRVNSNTTGTRLLYIIAFLDYLYKIGLRKISKPIDRRIAREEWTIMLDSLKERVQDGEEDERYKRQGLTAESQEILWEIIEPTSPQNPWGKDVRVRNKTIVRIIFGLGIRAGELLNLEIGDINFRTNKIFIRRFPDNSGDPRLYEPNVKTAPRELKVSDGLAETIEDYIRNERRKFKAANKHRFLVVEHNYGNPLSMSSLSNVFSQLKKIAGLPVDISPHVGRHTWNDNFSDYCDKNNISEERENTVRCKVMGWVKGSNMVLTYTRRHIASQTDKYLIGVQEQILQRKRGGLFNDFEIEDE